MVARFARAAWLLVALLCPVFAYAQSLPHATAVLRPPAGTYRAGDVLAFAVRFTRGEVAYSGSPRLTLQIGGATRHAPASWVSDTGALGFTYVVGSDDGTTDSVIIAPSIDLAGGSISVDGVVASTDLATEEVTWSGGIACTGVRLATRSEEPRLLPATVIGSGVNGSHFAYAPVVSGTVSGFTGENLPSGITVDPRTGRITQLGATGTFDARVTLRGGSASAALRLIGVNASPVEPDLREPASLGLPPDGTFHAGDTLAFSLTYQSPVAVAGSLKLPIAIGGVLRYADYVPGFGPETLVFHYTLAPEDNGIVTVRGEWDGDAIVHGDAGDCCRNWRFAPDTRGIVAGTLPRESTTLVIDTGASEAWGDVAAAFSYDIVSRNADPASVTYDVLALPPYLRVDTVTGRIFGYPVDRGEFASTLVVTDRTGTRMAPVTFRFVEKGSGPPANRLVNLSARGRVTPGDASRGMIAGFVVTGASNQILVRAVGPSLEALGVSAPLPNPQLRIYNSAGHVVAANAGWADDPEIATASGELGAFGLTAGSTDAAMLLTLAPGAYTAQVDSAQSGTVLLEVYDAAANAAIPSRQLVNLSARANVGTGEDIVFAGFVVAGPEPKRVLVRGVGPGLVQLGVSGVLEDPEMKLFHSDGRVLARNGNWQSVQKNDVIRDLGNAAEIAAASAATGAFGLTPGSRDSALLLTLEPGAYTVGISGANGSTGAALVEVYEVP